MNTFRHASVSSTYIGQSVSWLVILLNMVDMDMVYVTKTKVLYFFNRIQGIMVNMADTDTDTDYFFRGYSFSGGEYFFNKSPNSPSQLVPHSTGSPQTTGPSFNWFHNPQSTGP